MLMIRLLTEVVVVAGGGGEEGESSQSLSHMSAISVQGMKAHRLPSDGVLWRAAFIQTETLLNCIQP